jgi:uncharacterized protein YggE
VKEFRLPAFIIIFSFICLYVFSKVLGPLPLSITSVTTTKTDLFTSTATGEVDSTPTTAHVSLGVTKTAATADEAKNQLNEVINKVTADIKALGIEDKDIKTTNFLVNPDYSEPRPLTLSVKPGVQDTGRYTGTANIEVDTKDVATANKAVDIASADGANLIGNVSFAVSDEEREGLEDQAREKAIQNAKAKAEKIAKAAGLKLGRLVNISESSGGPQPVFMDARAADLKTTGSAPTDLQPGQNTIQITVTLSYETL